MATPIDQIESPASCRRCGNPFTLPDPGRLSACPHCGAAVVPLHRRLSRNGLSAATALLALLVLIGSFVLPFISVTALNQTTTHSLPGSIHHLLTHGHAFIGVVLLVFSILFPIAKLLALLVATTRLVELSPRARHRLAKAAVVTGKYSLLDVFVVAILIVSFQLGGLASAQPQAGVGLFTVAILLSLASGILADLPAQ